MKLIQLNALGGVLSRPLDSFFAKQNADIIMLQEVLSSPEGKSFYFDFLQRAQEHAQLDHAFFTPVFDHIHAGKRTYFGTAIIARQNFQETYDEFVHLSYIKDWDAEVDSDDIKAFQHAVLPTPNGVSIHLINYHGLNVRNINKQGNAETERHCARIAEYISGLTGPKIVTGDFNLAPNSKSLQPINAALRNLCIENGITTTRNPLARDMTTVDYIWVSDDITVNRFEVLPDLVSDHAALMLDFDL